MSASHDVVIVGAGGAGLRAAIAVSETNPPLSVAVVSKVYPMRSHTVSAEGGAAGAIAADDSLDEHAYDTISGGDWLCDQDAVEAFIEEAPKELLQLEHWGCPWSRTPDGRVAVRAFGGMKKMRTWFAADKTGFHMLHALFQTSLKYSEVRRYDEEFVTRLLVDDGRVHGVVAIELMTGRIQAVTAKAVVLCTGGCGKVFPFTTNANINTGDGMALAYRAGAPLKDMEFVQYHPTGLPFTGILITEAARAEGGWLLNKDGYRYLQDYNLGKPEPKPVLRSMELGPRDPASAVLAQAHDEKRRLERDFLRKDGGTERLATIREEMQRTMEQGAGIYRSGAALTVSADVLRKLQERFRAVALMDRSRTFNTELAAALELGFMLDVAETIVQSALRREESRGAHQRTDFPARDDQRFLSHSLAWRNPDGSCRIEYLPVTITRWPPAERVYGK